MVFRWWINAFNTQLSLWMQRRDFTWVSSELFCIRASSPHCAAQHIIRFLGSVDGSLQSTEGNWLLKKQKKHICWYIQKENENNTNYCQVTVFVRSLQAVCEIISVLTLCTGNECVNTAFGQLRNFFFWQCTLKLEFLCVLNVKREVSV